MSDREQNYNGVKIIPISSRRKQIEATASFSDKKIVFRGELGIDRTEGSYKWGPQVLIALWSFELPKIDSRCNNKGYSRVQIAISREDAKKLFKEALAELEKLEPTQSKLG